MANIKTTRGGLEYIENIQPHTVTQLRTNPNGRRTAPNPNQEGRRRTKKNPRERADIQFTAAPEYNSQSSETEEEETEDIPSWDCPTCGNVVLGTETCPYCYFVPTAGKMTSREEEYRTDMGDTPQDIPAVEEEIFEAKPGPPMTPPKGDKSRLPRPKAESWCSAREIDGFADQLQSTSDIRITKTLKDDGDSRRSHGEYQTRHDKHRIDDEYVVVDRNGPYRPDRGRDGREDRGRDSREPDRGRDGREQWAKSQTTAGYQATEDDQYDSRSESETGTEEGHSSRYEQKRSRRRESDPRETRKNDEHTSLLDTERSEKSMRSYMAIVVILLMLCIGALCYWLTASASREDSDPYEPYISDDTSDWMNNMNTELNGVFSTKALNTVVFPGTRHSASGFITTDLWDTATQEDIDWYYEFFGDGKIASEETITEILLAWKQSEYRSITRQLNEGIRYLDLPTCWDWENEVLYSCNGFYGETMQRTVNEIAYWHKQHPKEILILDFSAFYDFNGTAHEDLHALLLDKFEDVLVEPGTATSVSMQELWQANTNVILRYNSDDNDGSFWDADSIQRPNSGCNDESELVPFISANYIPVNTQDSSFFAHDFSCEPSSNSILMGWITPSLYPSSQYELASEYVNPEVYDQLTDGDWVGDNVGWNIMFWDFPKTSLLGQHAIALNKN